MYHNTINHLNILKHSLLIITFITTYYYLISNYLIGVIAIISNQFKKSPLFLFICIVSLKSQAIKYTVSSNISYNSIVSRSLSSCITMIYIILPILLLLNKKRTYYEPRVMYTSYVFSFIGILIHLKCLVNEFKTLLFIYTLIFTIAMFLGIVYIDLPNPFIPIIGHAVPENQTPPGPHDRTTEQIERSQVSENSYFKQFTDFFFGYTLNYKSKNQLQIIAIHSFTIFLTSLAFIIAQKKLQYFIYTSLGYTFLMICLVVLYFNYKYMMPVLYAFLISFSVSFFLQFQLINSFSSVLREFNMNEVTKDLIFYGCFYNLPELVLGICLINLRETEMSVYLIFISYTINLLTTPLMTFWLNKSCDFMVSDLQNYTRVVAVCFFIVSMFVTSISFEGSRSKLTKELGISLIITYILYLIIIFIQNKYGEKYFKKTKISNNFT